MTSRYRSLFGVLVLGLATAAPAAAEVPTATDFASCNMKAAEQAAADTVSASPRTDLPKDATTLPPDVRTQPRPDVQAPPSAAGKAGAPVLQDPTGNTLSSDKDPQIEGMAADRANDKAYVAAYRSCMRQRGF
ncbi:MAG: hypothetical protein FJ027_20685 [Candidatus Rokubacteria bacterium]|nr:hypothetical protein [Candidatus Rokubacteria bacterium]